MVASVIPHIWTWDRGRGPVEVDGEPELLVPILGPRAPVSPRRRSFVPRCARRGRINAVRWWLVLSAVLLLGTGCGPDRTIRVNAGGIILVPRSLPELAEELRASGGEVFVGALEGELRYRGMGDPLEMDRDVFLIFDYWEGDYRVVDPLGATTLADTQELFGRHTNPRVVDASGASRDDVIIENLDWSGVEHFRMPTGPEPHVLFVMDVGWLRWTAAVAEDGTVDGSATGTGDDVSLEDLRLP